MEWTAMTSVGDEAESLGHEMEPRVGSEGVLGSTSAAMGQSSG